MIEKYQKSIYSILVKEQGEDLYLNFKTGSKFYLNSANQLHRKDNPALIYDHGSYYYYQNGVRHREDGPAINSCGNKYWYLNGINLGNKEKFLEAQKDKVIYMDELPYLIDGRLIKDF